MPDTDERLDRIETQFDLLAAQVVRNFAILEKALKEHVESVVKEHTEEEMTKPQAALGGPRRGHP